MSEVGNYNELGEFMGPLAQPESTGARRVVQVNGSDVLISPTAAELIAANPEFIIAAGGGVVVNTSPVSSGTNTRIFFQNAGVMSQSANLTYNSGTDVFATGAATTVVIPYLIGLDNTFQKGLIGDLEQYVGGFGASTLGFSNFAGDAFVNVTDAEISGEWKVVSATQDPIFLFKSDPGAVTNLGSFSMVTGLDSDNHTVIGFGTGLKLTTAIGLGPIAGNNPNAVGTMGFFMEANFNTGGAATVPYVLQHEFYATDGGNNRVLGGAIGAFESQAVLSIVGGLVTTSGNNLLEVNDRFWFDALTTPTPGQAVVATRYYVKTKPSGSTFTYSATPGGAALVGAANTTGTWKRGDWGSVFVNGTFAVSAGTDDYDEVSLPVSGAVASFVNTKIAHGATVTVKNTATTGNMFASFQMIGNNGASNWNFTTLDHVVGPDFAIYEAGGPYYAMIIKQTTGFIGIGDQATAPATLLHVGGTITTGVQGAVTGSLVFKHASHAFGATFTQSNVQSAATAYTLPVALPASNKVLQCTSAGVLSWTTATGVAVLDESADTTCFPVFVTAATGDLGLKTNAGLLQFNSATGLLNFAGGSIALAGFTVSAPTAGGAVITNASIANLSTQGTASGSAIKASGVPFAGTGTTSFPLVYINDANATASTTLNTAGTYFGVNGDGTQDLANLMKDGVSQFKVSSTGDTTVAGLIKNSGGIKRLTADFPKSTDGLSDVTGLSVTVVAGQTYKFRAVLFTDPGGTGGQKFAIAGTATATSIIYAGVYVDHDSTNQSQSSRSTSLGGAVGTVAGSTQTLTTIEGTIVVNAGGTLTVQFAQSVTDAVASTVKAGSYFEVFGL